MKKAHTTREVAAALALSERKVKELIGTGELPSIKIGKSRRVTDSQIEQFLNQKEQDRAA